MSENSALHQVRICENPDCAFRFPVNPTEKRIELCPKCGAQTHLAEEPYQSFAVRRVSLSANPTPIIAVLDNIRSAFNVGAMFRTADGAGFSSLVLCGITPTPAHPKVAKTALGAENAVSWSHCWDVVEAVQQLKQDGCQIWALEGGETSQLIFDELPSIRDDAPIALVVGNEVSGIDPAVIKLCDHCVFLPMEGIKESLNAAIAFGIAAYLIRYRAKYHD